MVPPAQSNPALDVIMAFNDRDFERGRSLIAEDCEVLEVPTGERWKGRDGLQAEFERWDAFIPDGSNEINTVIDSGDWVVLEGILGGTHTGPFVLPDRTIEPTGKEFSFPYCTVARIMDGKQAHAKHYYDLGTILTQLGVAP